MVSEPLRPRKLPCIMHLASSPSPNLPTDFTDDPKIEVDVEEHEIDRELPGDCAYRRPAERIRQNTRIPVVHQELHCHADEVGDSKHQSGEKYLVAELLPVPLPGVLDFPAGEVSTEYSVDQQEPNAGDKPTRPYGTPSFLKREKDPTEYRHYSPGPHCSAFT